MKHIIEKVWVKDSVLRVHLFDDISGEIEIVETPLISIKTDKANVYKAGIQ